MVIPRSSGKGGTWNLKPDWVYCGLTIQNTCVRRVARRKVMRESCILFLVRQAFHWFIFSKIDGYG